MCVFYPTGKHDYQHSCSDLNVCFWPNYLYPTATSVPSTRTRRSP